MKNLGILNDKLVSSSKLYFVKLLNKKQQIVIASSVDNERSQNDLPNLNTQYAGSQFNNDLGMSMKKC